MSLRSLTSLFVLFSAAAFASDGQDPVVRLSPFHTDATVWSAPAGFDAEALGVTRQVVIVPRELLDDLCLDRIEDVAVFLPGAISAPVYGLSGVPTIRGDLGDAAWNGQRKAWNRNQFPPSFNAIEAIELLAGAAPPTLGYTHGTGGFVNFVTKQPAWQSRTLLALTHGAWNDRRAAVDTTGPLSSRLAYRIAYERTEADSFYRLLSTRTESAFLALAWRRSPQVRWDFNLEHYRARFAENPGINRPTQALIDHGHYITGSSVQQGGTGSLFGNTFTPTGTVTLDGSQILLAPGDGASARTWTAQLTGTFLTEADRSVVNRTYFESVSAEKYAAYTFYSDVPLSLTLENRTEHRRTVGRGGRTHALLAGVAVRAEERRSFVDFFNEAMNAFDLTLDPDTFRYPVGQLFGVRPVPGRPGRFAVSGARYPVPPTATLSQTLHSRLFNAGVFVEDAMTLGPRSQLVLATRADLLHVDAADPLPAPGYPAVSDSLKKVLPAVSASWRWQVCETLALHVTLQQAAAVEASSSSGGYGLTANRLPAALFANTSELVEVGLQHRVPDGRVAGRVSVFHQKRTRTNPRLGLPDEILVRGVEAFGEWSVTSRLRLTGNAGYQDAHYLDGPLPGGVATVPGFDPAWPSGTFGAYPPGDYRLPGMPRWTARVFVHYGVGAWRARVWGASQGEQNLDLFGRVVIPAQQTWNLGLTWRRGGWELSGDVLNLTNAFNWRPTSTPFAGGDLITRELPRHWRGTVRRTF